MGERIAKRVLLIGWDAADWQMIEPLMEKGWMPNLQQFVDRGVMGRIATLAPVISPILWNSIATGKRADKHGILGFLEPDGKGSVRPVTSTSRKAKAIWNILSQQGLRSNVVGWFASHPAEPINGCVISDRYHHIDPLRADHGPCEAAAIHPGDLRDVLLSLRVSANDITAQQILPFIPEAHRIKQPEDIRLAAFCEGVAEASTIHNSATYLMEHTSWDFMAIYYEAIDHIAHGFMEYHPPKMPHVSQEDFEIYQHVMNGVYMWHDMMLGRLVELAGPETAIIILSDHGFLSDERRPLFYVDPQNPKQRTGPATNPVAWHRLQGILCAAGPGIKEDELVHGASLLDIAPTVLAMLGLPIPNDMDGKVQTQIFATPPQLERIETYEGEHPHDGVLRGEQAEDPFAAQATLNRLVDLGYVDAPGEEHSKALKRTMLDLKHNLAQVLFSADRFAESLALLQEVQREEDFPHLRARMAMCLMPLGRIDEAEAMLRGAADDPLSNPVASLYYAEILAIRGRWKDAEAILMTLEKSSVSSARVFVLMGRVFVAKQQYEDAERSLRRALEIDPDEAVAHDLLGVALRQMGRTEDAVYEHMRSVSLVHARGETHLNLGIALAQLKQVDWAIRAFHVATELAPRHPLPHRCLSQLYRHAKLDFEKARFHAGEARRLRQALWAQGVLPLDGLKPLPV